MTFSKNIEHSVNLPILSGLIALAGATLAMWGASWDITSHLLRTPETFFTPSHGILYSGVGMSLIGAILSVFILRNKVTRNYSFSFGLKLILVGSIMQIMAGPGDFFWHEQFGIDGLLSPTHITLALGIMISLIGAIICIGRIYLNLKRDTFLKIILSISFGILWFSIMWLIFFFVLPISEGDTHDLNPNPYFAVVLGIAVIPFVFSIVFWVSHHTLNHFGAASLSALTFIMMNVTSNILTSENLLPYTSWFVIPLVGAITADYVLSKKGRLGSHSKKIAGIILGSLFFVFCFPMLSMTFLEFYVHNDVFPYDVLPTASDTVLDIWIMVMAPGALSGTIGMIFASRKLNFPITS